MKGTDMRFFKNRNVQIHLVKPKKIDGTESTTEEVINPENIQAAEEAVKRLVIFTASVVTAAVVAIKLADTLSDIAVKKTKSADKD